MNGADAYKVGLGTKARHRLTIAGVTLSSLALFFLGSVNAGGGGGTSLDVTIREGLKNQAVLVGVLILSAVYLLIIFEWVHRTLAASIGGIVAVGALIYSITCNQEWPD